MLDAMYVGKCRYRDDPVAAHYVQENHLRIEHLVPTLEWIGGTESSWALKPGPHGRRMKSWLRPDLWSALIATYARIDDPIASWESLIRTIRLFRKACLEVGAFYGFGYPEEVEAGTLEFLNELKHKDRLRRASS